MAYDCIRTSDNGFIAVGFTESSDGDVTGWHEGYDSESNATSDIWVVKLAGDGSLEWERCYGGSKDEVGYSIRETADLGFVIAGSSASSDGEVTANKGEEDAWVIKIAADGTIEWERNYGGSKSDILQVIEPTSDGGYVAAGYSYSSDGNVKENLGGADYWLIKVSPDGELEWEKTYGGKKDDKASQLLVMPDDGYTIGGFSESYDGGYGDLIIKLSKDGAVETAKRFGGRNLMGLQYTSDGSYVMTGFTGPETGDSRGATWATRQSAEMEFQLEMGFPDEGGIVHRVRDLGLPVEADELGGYLFTGYIGAEQDPSDVWIAKIGPNGEQILPTNEMFWQLSYGGNAEDIASSIRPAEDGSYILAAYTNSTDGDIKSENGDWDFCIIKLIHDYKLK